MANYTGIQGQNILIVSSDPSNPVEGQIWYNSTTNLLKGYANVVTNAWATGGNLNTARFGLAGVGTTNAALAIGGFPDTAINESYNGTSWTEVNDLPTATGLAGTAGTQTAALAFGGNTPAGSTTATRSWNGTSWSTIPATMNTGRDNFGSSGITTNSALAFGNANTESYNGTSWSEVADINTARSGVGGSGTSNSNALCFGGENVGAAELTLNESWNGSTWTELNDLNTARNNGDGSGSNTSTLAFGGISPAGSPTNTATTDTELWNGTTWTETNNLSVARFSGASGKGTSNGSAIFAGGVSAGSPKSATEEWTGDALATRTITTS